MERKLATILFADLVGSTELGASLDPEYARDLLDRFYDAMEAEIALGGGTIEKFIGDAVVAVFGAPAAQEDHAERALQVALWMQERLQELFRGRLSLRIGVNSGEVAVGRPREGSSFATGDAVNVAARLEQAAEPGQVLVGERTASIVGDAFELGEPRTVEAKGKEGGVACRELGRMLSARRPRGGHGLEARFVGRKRELEWLADMLARTRADGHPRLATVVGEAGMGKTSLVREFRERLPAGTEFRLGRCLSYGRSVTYNALADVLRQELGLRQEDSAEEMLERLAGREILGLTVGLDVAGDLEPRAALLQLQDQWVTLISQLGERGPAVMVIEDLHWAAEPLVEVLERVLADAEGPVLVLATARLERADFPAPDVLSLERLADEEVSELVAAALAAPLEARALELVTRHAEGNPFFVEEVLADLLERRLLERRNGGWSLRDAGVDLGIPDSVQGVLAARIDLLPAEAKEALQAASVIGRSFTPGGLAALTGSSAEVRTLVERGFVRPTEPELVFKHALTRDVAYSSLPKASRARLHAAFARWLEADDATDGRAGVLAQHYSEAVAPGIVELAWRDHEEELRRAVGGGTALATACRRALAGALRPRGHTLAASSRRRDRAGRRRGVACDRPRERFEVRRRGHVVGHGEGDRADGGHGGARRAVRGAHVRIDHARRDVEASARTRAWSRAGSPERSSSRMRGAHAQARAFVTKSMWEDDAELAEQAVALAERLDDPVLLSYAYWVRSGAAFVEPRLPRGRPLGAAPLRAHRSPDRSGQDRAHLFLRSDRCARRRPAGRGRGARGASTTSSPHA